MDTTQFRKCVPTLFFTFNNIQTLLKSHRIGGEHQRKILAIVVCSILCTSWEKDLNIQFLHVNSPASWDTTYKYEPKNHIFIDIKEALDFVTKDMNESNDDTIDIKTKKSIAKKYKNKNIRKYL